jgi:hypothetical protein
VTPAEWAFLQNFYADQMNACIHCSDVRFSPITFRLWEELPKARAYSEGGPLFHAWSVVNSHHGAYTEDKGR